MPQQFLPDFERNFFKTLEEALPYLFLAPDEFRDKIAKLLNGIYHQYRSGMSGRSTQYITDITTINELLLGAEDTFGSQTKERVVAFKSMYQSIDNRITELEQWRHGLKHRVNKKNRVNKKIPNVPEDPVVPDVPAAPEKSNLHITQTAKVLAYISEHHGETAKQIIIGTELPPPSCRKVIFDLYKNGKITRDETMGLKHSMYYPKE